MKDFVGFEEFREASALSKADPHYLPPYGNDIITLPPYGIFTPVERFEPARPPYGEDPFLTGR